MAIEIYSNTIKQPNEAPAQKALLKLDQVSNLFRNTHALMKHNKNFKDYVWLCDLDEKKGLSIGKTYRNPKAAKTFSSFIAESECKVLSDDIDSAPFIALTMDGSTDAGIIEQEIIFAR
jgi:hypothetical protein